MLVLYYHKSEQAMGHLNRCEPFRRLTMAKKDSERPMWFTGKKRKSCSLPSPDPKQQTMFTKVPPTTQAAFDKAIALHYYLTGTAFERVEEKNLLTAVQVFFSFFFFFFKDEIH